MKQAMICFFYLYLYAQPCGMGCIPARAVLDSRSILAGGEADTRASAAGWMKTDVYEEWKTETIPGTECWIRVLFLFVPAVVRIAAPFLVLLFSWKSGEGFHGFYKQA